MSAYVVFIREKTTDPVEFAAYAKAAPSARTPDLSAPAFYGPMEVLEGPNAEGVAILRFDDMASAKAWYNSPAYQEARQHRLKGAEYRLFLVEGTDVKKD